MNGQKVQCKHFMLLHWLYHHMCSNIEYIFLKFVGSSNVGINITINTLSIAICIFLGLDLSTDLMGHIYIY